MKVKRTERGWAGHFILSYRCRFRRNTLLECGDIKIIVSTVGNYVNPDNLIEKLGFNRYYETMAFHSDPNDTRYNDANVSRQVYFASPWEIGSTDADNEANEMHEMVVKEISRNLAKGVLYETE